MTPETWRPIPRPEYLGRYEVSDLGRVRHVGRPSELAVIRRDGYPTVDLWHEGKPKRWAVQQLVCEAFHGPKPSPAHRVHVLNGKPWVATAANLRWMTRAEAAAHDRTRDDARPAGKLSTREAREIAALRLIRVAIPKRGMVAQVAAAYGIDHMEVTHIWNGRRWRGIKPTADDRANGLVRAGLAERRA